MIRKKVTSTLVLDFNHYFDAFCSSPLSAKRITTLSQWGRCLQCEFTSANIIWQTIFQLPHFAIDNVIITRAISEKCARIFQWSINLNWIHICHQLTCVFELYLPPFDSCIKVRIWLVSYILCMNYPCLISYRLPPCTDFSTDTYTFALEQKTS